MSQYLRPNSLISAGGWSGTYTAIDETSPDTSDFLTGPNKSDGTWQGGLTSGSDPSVHTGHILRINAYSVGTYGSGINLYVELRQGTTLIKSWNPTLTTSFASYNTTLLETEADDITDYSNLNISFNQDYITGATGRCYVAWFELEIPEPPAVVFPSSIGSGESFNSPTVGVGSVSISPSSISSGEAFSEAQLNLFLTISSISSQEAFEEADISQGINLFPSSISSEENFDSHTITTGAVSIIPDPITSLENFPQHTVSMPDLEVLVEIRNNEGFIFVTENNSYGRAISKLLSRSNIDFRCSFQFGDNNSSAMFKVFLRTSNDWYDWKSPTTGYEISINNTGSWQVNYLSSGSVTQLANHSWTANTSSNELHFAVYNNMIGAAIWLSGDPESQWQEVIEDTSGSSPGSIQLGYFGNANNHLIYLDDIVIKQSSLIGYGIILNPIPSAEAFGSIVIEGGAQIENVFGPLVQII